MKYHKHRIHLYFALGLIICVPMTSYGQQEQAKDPFRKLPPSELSSDFDYLIKRAAANSFEPYLINTKRQTDSLAASIKNKLADSMTIVQFFRLIKPYVAAFHDAHLTLALPDVYFDQFQKDGGKLFPFTVAIDRRRLFIDDNLSGDASIKKGTEISSINNIATKKLLGDMFNFISGDTYPYKINMAEQRFRLLLWWIYGFGNGFDIVFTNGQHAVIKNIPEAPPDTSNKAVFGFKTVRNTGIMKISGFNGELQKTFDQYLQNTFAQIKQLHINALIIDIRRNGGGSTDLVNDLYDYITTKPFMFGTSETYVENGEIKIDHVTKPDTPKAVSNRFNGKVFLLIDARTYSTAFMMANTFQYFKMGVTVGDSSAEQMQMSGEVRQSGLPNSGLVLYCPITAFTIPNHNGNDKRLYPDYYIVPSLQDKLNKTDVTLNYCLKLAACK
jgi:hypothetical protein